MKQNLFSVKERSSLDVETSKSKKGQKSGNQSAVKFDDSPQDGEGEDETASPTALAMLDRLSQYVGCSISQTITVHSPV